jgi:hypothetical protein
VYIQESEDKKDIYIIILLADFDDDWRRNVTNKIKELYSDDVQEGTIQVLQSFSWMYPKLDNLTHHYSWHPESRVRWKAKQNIDFCNMIGLKLKYVKSAGCSS